MFYRIRVTSVRHNGKWVTPSASRADNIYILYPPPRPQLSWLCANLCTDTANGDLPLVFAYQCPVLYHLVVSDSALRQINTLSYSAHPVTVGC